MYKENVVYKNKEIVCSLEKKEILSHVSKLKDIKLSKISQSQKDKHRMFSLIWNA